MKRFVEGVDRGQSTLFGCGFFGFSVGSERAADHSLGKVDHSVYRRDLKKSRAVPYTGLSRL